MGVNRTAHIRDPYTKPDKSQFLEKPNSYRRARMLPELGGCACESTTSVGLSGNLFRAYRLCLGGRHPGFHLSSISDVILSV